MANNDSEFVVPYVDRSNKPVNLKPTGYYPEYPISDGIQTVFSLAGREGTQIGSQRIENIPLSRPDPTLLTFKDSSGVKMSLWENMSIIRRSTRAGYAFDILKQHKYALIVGRKGDGKTSLAREIILAHKEMMDVIRRDKTLIVEIEDPSEILEIVSRGVKGNVIFLADDALGKSAVDDKQLEKWQRKSDDVVALLQNSDKFKLVITMRKYIWNKTKSFLEGYDLFENLVDLTSMDMDLRKHEKEDILLAHLNKNRREPSNTNLAWDVSQTLPTTPGYPQCCSMFSRVTEVYNEGVQFFKKPSSYFVKIINELHAAEPNLYATLVLIFLFGGQFKMTFFSKAFLDANGEIKACVEEIMTGCGTGGRGSLGQLKSYFEALRDVCVEQDEEQLSFRFNHDSIEEAVAKHFGDNYTDLLIKCCHIKSLQQWVRTAEEYRNDQGQHVIFLHKAHFQSLAQRLNKELFKGNVDFAFSPAQGENFVSVWVGSLVQLKDLDELLKSEGKKMLVQASKNGVQLFVEYLLKEPQRSLICLTTSDIDSAMTAAACNDHPGIMEILLPLGVSSKTLENAFELAVEIGILNSTRCLLKHSPQLLSRKISVKRNSCENSLVDDTHSQHAIHLAAYHGSADVLEYFISRGIEPNLVDSRGRTPLHYACGNYKNKNKTIIEILLSHPTTDINIVDCDKRTPMHYAAQHGFEDIVSDLEEANADMDLRDVTGKTAIELGEDLGFQFD